MILNTSIEKFKSLIHYDFRMTQWNSIRVLLIILIISLICSYIIKTKYISTTTLIISNNEYVLTTSHRGKMRCIIYLEERAGRLGNQLFRIASAYGLARLHSCHLYIIQNITNEMKSIFTLDLSPLLISSSTYNSTFNNISKPINKTMMDISCQYIPELTRPNAISEGSIFELRGFWQSYLHFAKYGDELRERIFVPKQSILEKVSIFFIDLYKQKLGFKPKFSFESHQTFKKQLTNSNRITWIGVHVRRKDFFYNNYHSSDEYLLTAIRYYSAHYSNTYFIVAGDDKPYCKNLFRNRSNIFVTPRSFSPGDDLITLSLCEHSIITGGTFGWWAAYLANGEVLHDKVYPSDCERREYYYPPWFLIDGNVRAHKNTPYILK